MLIGVLGAGQLGRMLGLAGLPLGARFRFLDPVANSPAREVGELHVASFEDHAALERFAQGVDVVTYEFENVPVEAVRFLAQRVPVRPGAAALEVGQDRLSEKTFFREIGIATPRFAAACTLEELRGAVNTIGTPCVVKTRRMGYDGKGQAVVRSPHEVEAVWRAVGRGVELIVEAFVPFEFEASIVACRGVDGRMMMYPMPRNVHEGGILRVSRVAAGGQGVEAAVQAMGERYAKLLLEKLGYVGTLAIEFFAVRTAGGLELWANEMAPRVHNSGHWTIDASVTSQFENHVRAVMGLPLGDTAMRCGAAAMVNLIGRVPGVKQLAGDPGAKLHLYGKEEKPGRKVGHVNVIAATAAERDAGVERIQTLIKNTSNA